MGYLRKDTFADYWIQSGSQQFLEKYFHETTPDWNDLDGEMITHNEIMYTTEVGLSSSPKNILYQSGYLTISETPDINKFTLTYPNLEVRNALYPLVFTNFFDNETTATEAKSDIQQKKEMCKKTSSRDVES